MIIIKDCSYIDAYRQIFLSLYENETFNSCHPKHWRESVALVKIERKYLNNYLDVIFEDNNILYDFEIKDLIPGLDSKIISEEIEYYKKKYSKALSSLTFHLV